MLLDSIDKKILCENFDDDLLKQLNQENVNLIYDYLINKGIYFAKDIFISNAALFLMDCNLFIEKFNKLINQLGDNYVNQLEEDCSLIEFMYK